MSKLPLHLDLIPLDLAWCDPAENLKRMEKAIADRLAESPSLPKESRLFVFPETTLTAFVTGADCRSLDPESSEVRAALALAKKHGVGLVFGFPEKVPGQERPLNTLYLVSPEGRKLAAYHKQHLFTGGASPESGCFAHGSSGTLAHYRGWKIGFGICFDLRFPAMFLPYARKGADLLLLPSCWLGGPGKSYQFRTMAAARAIENQAFFAALNRSGKDPYATYEGEALCFSPKGEPLPAVAGLQLDPALLEDARKLSVRASELASYTAFEG
jgi:predicted amidohydrolase